MDKKDIKMNDKFWMMVDNIPQEFYITKIITKQVSSIYTKYKPSDDTDDTTIYHAARYSDHVNIGFCEHRELIRATLYSKKQECIDSLINVTIDTKQVNPFKLK